MSTVIDAPEGALRQSTLSTFDRCPLSAKLEAQYTVLKKEEPHNVIEWSSHPQARGTIAHRTFARCMEVMSENGEDRIETDIAQAILLEQLRQSDVDIEDVVPVPLDEAKDLYWIVTKWAYDNTWSIRSLVSVEERLSVPIRYPDPKGGFIERIITGQTDVIFGEGTHAIVIDYKDTWGLPGPTDLSFDGYFQQRVYAWLIMRSYPAVESVTLREFYVRFSEVREATLFRQDLAEIEGELSALVERYDRAMETNVWKPAPGKHCSYCLRPTACPIFPTARGEGRIQNDDDAAKVAAQVLVAEAALKQSKDSLKVWAKEHGPIPVKDAKEPNRIFGFQITNRTSRPDKETLAAALAAKGGPLTEKEIDALYRTDVGTTFKQHVPEPVIEPDSDIIDKLRASVEAAEARRTA